MVGDTFIVGLFKTAKKNSIIIDSSTISPMKAEELSNKARQVGMEYVDAPVSGGVGGATAGTLTFMVGSHSKDVFERCRVVLEAMGKNLFNTGKAGGGQIAKLCNNMSLAVIMIGISESLAMAKNLGMDPKIASEIMSVSTASCFVNNTYNPIPGYIPTAPASRDYENGFKVDLMLKDLKLAYEAARESKTTTSMGDKSQAIYQELTNKGYGSKDYSIIFDVL